ncbi:hypothetical protein [Actibacterium sp. XHP0104]|uniref:hypothetical protein n=1 Tax=Actibacterium sp. XHP0104 TaxID=2984335 RepID=UPI0021E76674|nr:hypothetical protein [Actibacterium sp. XHP0104]MCV2880935.1 hypothetical protein [Actibacterium sp. XHP0104]
MKKPLLVALLAATLLSSCGKVRESRINPFNWFGKDREEAVEIVIPEDGVIDSRPMVAEVVSLRIDKMPGGAIITATGLARTQGYWDAELVAEYDEKPVDGVLSYQFRTYPPLARLPEGSPRTRELTAAHFVSDQTLEGVRSIVVKGASNQRSSRR